MSWLVDTCLSWGLGPKDKLESVTKRMRNNLQGGEVDQTGVRCGGERCRGLHGHTALEPFGHRASVFGLEHFRLSDP